MNKIERGDSLLLMRKDQANGFSTMADGYHNLTLLKEGKLIAWFSRVMSEEVLKAFMELVKDFEKSTKWSI